MIFNFFRKIVRIFGKRGKCNEPSQCLDSSCGWGYDLGTEKMGEGALMIPAFELRRRARASLGMNVFGSLWLVVLPCVSKASSAAPQPTQKSSPVRSQNLFWGKWCGVQGKSTANPFGFASILTQQTHHFPEINRVRLRRLWLISANKKRLNRS